MSMKGMLTLLGVLVAGSAAAADYAVSVVNGTIGPFGGGAINLYVTSEHGIDHVSSFVFDQIDYTGYPATPFLAVINPAGTFVYAAYSGNNQSNGEPVLVGLKVTGTKLEYQWQQELETGDSGLQGATLVAGPDYVIENTFPDPLSPFPLALYVVNQTGTQILSDGGKGTGMQVVAGIVNPTASLYYSCRSATGSSPATEVSVYALKAGVDVKTGTAKPAGHSTNPAYVEAVCGNAASRFGTTILFGSVLNN